MKRIYLHTTDTEKKDAVGSLCLKQAAELRFLSGKDVNRTIAEICNVPLEIKNTAKSAPVLYTLPEIMLFYGMDDKALDSFLDAYNETGNKKIRLKAVVTPTNLGWTLYELAEHLDKEAQV